MMPMPPGESLHAQRRTGAFLVLLLITNAVMDGLPQVSTASVIQILLLPFTGVFLLTAFIFLRDDSAVGIAAGAGWTGWLASEKRLHRFAAGLECCFVGLFFYETRHFAALGYRLAVLPDAFTLGSVVLLVLFVSFRYLSVPAPMQLAIYLGGYAAGQVLAILSFPLSYLRSDMLPVIFWADRALLSGQNPYQPFHVAERIYDFPYLPGMLLAFAPAQAMHLDLRWACIFYILAGMFLLYRETLAVYRRHSAVLIGLFVLCPYLQYRHELYTQPHFFSLILTFVLLHRRLFLWSGAAFGLSMVISQFSWVIFPFFLLYALRRNGWSEVVRMIAVAAVVIVILLAPFLHSGASGIAHNAVGQWDRLERPIARPINLSFWATYVIRPRNLKWLQLTLLSAMFLYCWARGRCSNLVDTLRWMIVALLTFILFNVLVDGYFYLMLLVPMLVYTCAANGWWSPGEEAGSV